MPKTEFVGTVVSDKMDQSVVVVVERQVRHGVYGKIQRRSTRFMAHNEGNAAKSGDKVAIRESRPQSARKRFTVARIVEKAPQV